MKVDIWVRSERAFRGESEHAMREEYRTSGTLKKTKEGYRVLFSEKGGLTDVQIDTYSDGMVSVSKLGLFNTHMLFCEEARVPIFCVCDSGFGDLKMKIRVRTKSIENTLTDIGGKIEIEYSVEIAGALAERNHIGFSISPDRSIITS